MKYDVIIVGAGPGGIYSAYELMKKMQQPQYHFQAHSHYRSLS